jgi:quercetin dioxygenase-like cupin family protein
MIWRNAAAGAVFSPEKMGKVSLGEGEKLYAGMNCFEPGQEHKAHTHADQDKLYVVLEGSGEATIGDETAGVAAGDVMLARAGVVHGLKAAAHSRLVVLVVFSPPPR